MRAPASDASAQLMQLREAEAFGMFDDDDRGFRYVDADFDHGRRDKNLRLALGEGGHRLVAVSGLHLAMHEPDPRAQNCRQRGEAFFDRGDIELFAFGDERADPIGAGAVRHGALQPRDDIADPLERQRAGFDLLAAGRLFAQSRTSMSPK